ncbi:MAG: extracellular solute-binding protein [Firmicutes bacterium]|nr:extracellular solute-binding protein [Bacillota bacterium]
MKKIAILLMLVLALIVAVACNRDSATQETTTPDVPAPPEQQQAPAIEAESTQDEPEPVVARDLNRTIRVACWWVYMPDTGSDPPDPATATNYHNARLWYDNQRRIEESFNVTFENVATPWGYVLPNLTASVMAGDPFAEWVMLPGDHMLPAIMGDLALPASVFASPTSDLMTLNQFVEQRVSFQGVLYGFGRAELRTQSTGLGVNLEIIRAIGAQNPVDLWENGQWTWDAMRELMALATRDTTGDGSIDQFGISGYPGQIMRNLIATNSGLLVNENTLQFAMEDPRTVTALEFMEEIFRNGWWNYDRGSGNPLGDWNRNTWIYQQGNDALFPIATWKVAEQGVEFDFAVVPFPTGPQGGQYNNLVGFYQAILIPNGTYNPQDVFMLYEELQSWARYEPELYTLGTINAMRNYWPTEGDVYRVLYVLGNREASKFELGFAINEFSWIFGTLGWYLFHGYQTPMQVIETQRPLRQEMIDNAFAGFD